MGKDITEMSACEQFADLMKKLNDLLGEEYCEEVVEALQRGVIREEKDKAKKDFIKIARNAGIKMDESGFDYLWKTLLKVYKEFVGGEDLAWLA